ncbi:TonB-dependent receptor [Psychrosphaera sp. G1-22]|uniref:TonB-dependent receptor n=1 Tax=Psychrosphaera algicola TaxID=3023714 RepID=A0ABT5FHU7_9GAMM|nr:TonB-dependent receptor [Psychrosphaera sp. G1-22]MDC2890771.1 TonB-dependent receptor [Psychrosphaera sp. G1-22]
MNETNTAAYVMVTMSGELGDIPFSGNVGLRYAKTEVTSTGHEQTNWGDINPISVDHDYSEFLPSLNMLFNITDDSQIRFGMARTMARPPLLEMRTGFSLDNTSLPPTANGGNPTLDPYIANQVDLGYEYFWGTIPPQPLTFS